MLVRIFSKNSQKCSPLINQSDIFFLRVVGGAAFGAEAHAAVVVAVEAAKINGCLFGNYFPFNFVSCHEKKVTLIRLKTLGNL